MESLMSCSTSSTSWTVGSRGERPFDHDAHIDGPGRSLRRVGRRGCRRWRADPAPGADARFPAGGSGSAPGDQQAQLDLWHIGECCDLLPPSQAGSEDRDSVSSVAVSYTHLTLPTNREV